MSSEISCVFCSPLDGSVTAMKAQGAETRQDLKSSRQLLDLEFGVERGTVSRTPFS